MPFLCGRDAGPLFSAAVMRVILVDSLARAGMPVSGQHGQRAGAESTGRDIQTAQAETYREASYTPKAKANSQCCTLTDTHTLSYRHTHTHTHCLTDTHTHTHTLAPA